MSWRILGGKDVRLGGGATTIRKFLDADLVDRSPDIRPTSHPQVLLGAAVELATIPYFSHLSDSVGRKRVYLAGAVIAGLFAFPYFAVLTYGGPVLIFAAIVLSMIVHSMMYGPQATLIGESFPTHLRYGGAGLGYQFASVFAGGPAPLLATWLLHETGTPYSISVYVVVAAVITVVCCLALPDRSRADIDDAAVYSRA